MSILTRYRPKTWEEFVGQEKVVDNLRAALESDVSAVLFSGPSGAGKTTLARLVATELDAELVELDAATYGGIDRIREFQTLVRFVPLEHTGRVIVVDEAHRLTGQAWDALLKLIEEPPEHVCFVFTTTNEAKVPKTIKTRCLRYVLRPYNDEELLSILERIVREEGIQADEDDLLESAILHAEGSPRAAIAALASGVEPQAEATADTVLLCQSMLKKQPWKVLMKHVAEIGDAEVETCRHVVLGYFAKVAMSQPSHLRVLAAFEQPFPENKRAHLVLAVGRATGQVGF